MADLVELLMAYSDLEDKNADLTVENERTNRFLKLEKHRSKVLDALAKNLTATRDRLETKLVTANDLLNQERETTAGLLEDKIDLERSRGIWEEIAHDRLMEKNEVDTQLNGANKTIAALRRELEWVKAQLASTGQDNTIIIADLEYANRELAKQVEQLEHQVRLLQAERGDDHVLMLRVTDVGSHGYTTDDVVCDTTDEDDIIWLVYSINKLFTQDGTPAAIMVYKRKDLERFQGLAKG